MANQYSSVISALQMDLKRREWACESKEALDDLENSMIKALSDGDLSSEERMQLLSKALGAFSIDFADIPSIMVPLFKGDFSGVIEALFRVAK